MRRMTRVRAAAAARYLLLQQRLHHRKSSSIHRLLGVTDVCVDDLQLRGVCEGVGAVADVVEQATERPHVGWGRRGGQVCVSRVCDTCVRVTCVCDTCV